MKLKKSIVSDSVKRALLEDGYKNDLSLKAKNINPKNILKASLISRENGILSGSLWFEESFKQIDKKAKIKWSVTEGEAFKKDKKNCRNKCQLTINSFRRENSFKFFTNDVWNIYQNK